MVTMMENTKVQDFAAAFLASENLHKCKNHVPELRTVETPKSGLFGVRGRSRVSQLARMSAIGSG